MKKSNFDECSANRPEHDPMSNSYVYPLPSNWQLTTPQNIGINTSEHGDISLKNESNYGEELWRTAYAQLEASHQHYLDLYHDAPVGYLTLDREGFIIEVNQTAADLISIVRQDLIGFPFERFLGADCKEVWRRHFVTAKSVSEIHGCELPLCRDKSAIIFIRLDCRYVINDMGEPFMRVTLTDVTERKKSEETLRIAAVAFETQEGILVTDASKNILRVNKAFTRITGYSAMEAIGSQPVFLRSGRYKEDDYQVIWETVSREGYWQGEMWDRHKNGSFIPVLLTISKVTDKNGLITHYVGNFTDITLQKQAEKILLDSHSQLERQVVTTQEELSSCKEESAEVKTVINYLIKNQEKGSSEVKQSFSYEMNTNVLPMIKKIKAVSKGRKQTNRLLSVLETNMELIAQSYGSENDLIAVYQKLTPIEAQIAALIRTGQPTKVIAAALNIASGTVNNHRKHIRKKLGLDSKQINLYSYLQSLHDSK